ncbi:CPBP family intramembrane metalloprotease [Neisseriaceae bacterium TC5R-5]|nr:CPBP family intramembrane metalloprotease [Neisseriaceae bacterium TC5R-5]
MPDSVTTAAFALLALALLAESLRLFWPSRLALISSLALAIWAERLHFSAIGLVLGALLLSYAVWRYQRAELYPVWLALLLAMALHALPGFDNPLLWQGYLTANSRYYQLYWNYDKALAGYCVLMVLSHSPLIQTQGKLALAWVGALLLLLILALAYFAGVLLWAPRWPIWFVYWLFANFFFVALVEEACFRAGLQRWLELRTEPFAALMASSLLFGLVHLAAGWEWAGLAFMAGLAYGLIYAATRQLLLAALAHVVFNSINLLLFSYS